MPTDVLKFSLYDPAINL